MTIFRQLVTKRRPGDFFNFEPCDDNGDHDDNDNNDNDDDDDTENKNNL